MRSLAPFSRSSFALTAVKCAHLLVMAEDGQEIPLPTPLQPRTRAIETMMRAAMRAALGQTVAVDPGTCGP